MQPPGLAEVERAQRDGRWDAAYESVGEATEPPDLQAVFDTDPGAGAFFAMLNSQNRYAVLVRIQTFMKAETQARKIAEYAAMVARHQMLYRMSKAR